MRNLTTVRTALLILFIVVVFVLVVGLTAIASAEATGEHGDRIPGQFIVVLKDDVENADEAEADIIGRTRGERIASYRMALKGFAMRMSEADVATVASDPRVAFVSEDRIVSIARDERAERPERVESAEVSERTAHLEGFFSNRRGGTPPPPPPPQLLPSGIDRINADLASSTGAGVHVAVIDTGIQLSHPDLQSNIVGGKNCTTSKTTDYGDQNGHGTHVAGTIAALDNGLGVVGVAPSAKLWAVRVLDRFGYGTWSSVICGLDFVASNGPANGGPITVANMSLGGGGASDNNCGDTNNDALHKAACRVRDAGVTLVVAAGNDGTDASGFVPAAYDDAVITVSALADSDGVSGGLGANTSYGADDTFASFSNFGSAVDIGAPGVNINSTWLSGTYKSISGTSMASPHVAGATALYLALHPGASWTTVRDALVASGEALGSGHVDPSGKHPEPVVRVDSL